MSLQLGDSGPDFTLRNTALEDVSLSSFQDESNVVLLFVPLAFTGVCTEEPCDVSAGISAYEELNAEVLGISVDSPFSLQAWAEKE